MYHVTELIAKFDKNNHKKIISSTVDRRNHSFETLRDLAHFTREHTIFTSYQKEISGIPRNNEAGKELYLGNNLLWIDMDFEVNLKTLKKKLEAVNLKCFAFYSSSYYNNSKAHARLCVICENIIDLDNWSQVKFYANQVLNKLNYSQIDELDKSIYNLSSYLSFVKGDYEEGDLIIVEGKPFKWITQEVFIKKSKAATSKKEKEEFSQKAGFGKSGDLALFLNTLPSIEKAIARNKGTISLAFTNITEKTELGYYINTIDPWSVYHPNKEPKYLSNYLSATDFEKFKEYHLNFKCKIIDTFKGQLKTNKIINQEFIEPEIFNTESLIFLESPTGSGKTTAISDWIYNNPTKSILFISVNRMQAIANYKFLKKRGIITTCYLKHSLKEYHSEKKGKRKVDIHNLKFQNDAIKGIIPDRLVCNILSLHHLMDDNGNLKKKYDCIIIDEITTLPNSASKSVKLIQERILSFEKGMKAFKKLLVESEKIICMDGFISNSAIDLVKDLSKKEPYIIQNIKPTNKKVEIYVCSGNQPKFNGKETCNKYLTKIMNDIETASFGLNKRLLVVALSSLELSKTLGELLQKKHPYKVIQVFNSEVTEKDGMLAIQMFEDLDKYLEDNLIDILVYSPTITTGIDIPQTKGTNVYQIISGDQLSSHTNYQMTMRGRNAKSYRILIAKSLMIDKQAQSFDNYIIDSIQEIKNVIPFKTPKSIEWKSRNFQTTGLFLAYYILEYNITEEEWKAIKDLKSLITALKNVSKKSFYDLEGVKIALKIDRAYINFQKELYLNGKNGYKQFINFLKHEKCKISIEEDIDYTSPNYYGKYKNNSNKYKESYKIDYTEKLKELNCWKEEYKKLSSIQLYRLLAIAKVFYILKEKLKVGVYPNLKLLDLYSTLYKKSFLKEYTEFRQFLSKKDDKEKIAFVKSILSVVFNTENIDRKGIIIKS